MIGYLFSLFRARAASLALAICGLTLALSLFFASLQVIGTLRSGHPSGTNFKGPPVSVFAYISQINSNFFLDPRQITALDAELGDTGRMLAAAGARHLAMTIDQEEVETRVVVDVVSSGLFEILGIRAYQGDLSGFEDAEPTVVVSQRFLESRGASPPQRVTMAGKSYRVIAVAEAFQGLFDSQTDMWVPWQHAHNILFPGLEDKGLLYQPGLYWALAIPNGGDSPAFRANLDAALQRKDLLSPPWDEFRSVDGITFSEPRRRNAEQAVMLYFVLTLGMVLVAALNIACWVGMLRASSARNDMVFIQLGMPLGKYLNNIFLCAFLPVVAAALIALPVSSVLTQFLTTTPPLDAFFTISNHLDAPTHAGRNLGLILAIILLCAFLGAVISRSSGVSYFSSSSRAQGSRVIYVFRGLVLFSSCVCALGFFLAASSLQYGSNMVQHLSYKGLDRVWFLPLQPGTAQGGEITHAELARVHLLAKGEVTNLQQLGFIQTPPLGTVYQPLSLSLEEFGDPLTSAFIQHVSHNAIPALGLDLLEGRLPADDESFVMLVDHSLAAQLRIASGSEDILGRSVYDSAAQRYEVVGVVNELPYHAEPDSNPMVAYVPARSAQSAPRVMVILGPRSEAEFAGFLDALMQDYGMQVAGVYSFSSLVAQKRLPFMTRLLFLVLACGGIAAIAALSLLAVYSMEFLHSRKKYAIFLALGATRGRLFWLASRSMIGLLLCAMGLAFVSGFYVAPELKTLGLMSENENLIVSVAVAALATLAVSFVCLLLAFVRAFHRSSPGELLAERQG